MSVTFCNIQPSHPCLTNNSCSSCLNPVKAKEGKAHILNGSLHHPIHAWCLENWIWHQLKKDIDPTCPTCQSNIVLPLKFRAARELRLMIKDCGVGVFVGSVMKAAMISSRLIGTAIAWTTVTVGPSTGAYLGSILVGVRVASILQSLIAEKTKNHGPLIERRVGPVMSGVLTVGLMGLSIKGGYAAEPVIEATLTYVAPFIEASVYMGMGVSVARALWGRREERFVTQTGRLMIKATECAIGSICLFKGFQYALIAGGNSGVVTRIGTGYLAGSGAGVMAAGMTMVALQAATIIAEVGITSAEFVALMTGNHAAVIGALAGSIVTEVAGAEPITGVAGVALAAVACGMMKRTIKR